uniref:Ion transport domain-containing protein n=1 Tax=Periophthalmus magnuspinnatus TaxID=409849 RepID=A0A3B3Z749_9GOBI
SRIPSLLPPVGTEVFRRFTPESLGQIKKCMDSKNKQVRIHKSQVEEDCRLKPAPELECGNVLPFFYGAPPPELQDVPLEDPDPFYQSQKTFVVVSKGNVLSRFNADSSCFHFSPFSLFRLALLVNLLFMFPHWTWEFIIDLVLLCIYTLEAVMKILSRGFCTRRHAKTFGRVLIGLLDVLFLTLLVLTVFSLMGMDLFTGVLRNTCVRNWEQTNSKNSFNYMEYIQNKVLFYFSMCPDGFTCLQVSNFRDMRNFDSFADAFLSTFRLMMRDYWEALAGEVNSERTCSSCWRLLCSCDCCDFWVRIKKGLQVFVLDPFFDLAIILLIILNVIFMSMEHYPLTEKFHSMLSLSHFVFTIIFLIEVVLKILALGPYVYFQVGWHIFETILVILSLFSLAIADVAYMVIVELMVLRLVRLIHLFKFRLARWWPGFLKWMRLVWIGLRSLWTLSLVVVVVFFTLFGNRFFTPDYGKNLCRLTEDCTITRWHTSDWLHAFMLVIRALCGEWIETMWDCVTVSTGFGCVLFYITLLIVGNFLVKCYSCCPALNLDTSRGFGRVWFNLRRSSFNIIQHPYFNNFIFFIIIVSSIALVWEDMYLPTRSTLMVFLGYLDQVITYLFVLEVLFKWLGLGFKKYFTDGWCWLDLIACVLSVVAQTSALGSVLISLKALRPLRILAHIKGTRVSVSALLRMLPSLLDALLVTATVWQFFSIVFVQFFAGKFEGCFNETCNIFSADVVPNKTECFVLIENNYTEVRWKKEPWNFDNTPQATLSLFSVESQPDYEANISSYFLFLAFFLFGCFFCCIYIIKMLLDGRLRGRLFDLVSREGFEWVMQVFIFVGVVLMMVERYDITEEEEHIIFWITFTLTLIFTIESFLKICAFRRSYFSDSLNVIDFVVVIYSIIDMFLADILLKYFFGGSLHLLRLARISRIIHRFPAALRVRFLFSAWTKSLRALFNLALVLFVLMFTYASFGTFHFAHLKKTNYMSDVYNFETFGNGLICMFMATTWAGWDGLIKPSLLTPPDCEPVDIPQENITANCGNASLAVVFYVSFLCLSCYVVLLMLLVLLVDMLNIFGRMHYDPLSAPNLNRFFKTWKKFVPDSAHFIQRSQLPDLCDKLKKPLRVPTLSNLDLSPEDPVSCRDVLLALSVQVTHGSKVNLILFLFLFFLITFINKTHTQKNKKTKTNVQIKSVNVPFIFIERC